MFAFRIDAVKEIPVIVTNKHVIEGAVKGTFVLTAKGEDGEPQIGTHHEIEFLDFEKHWIKHPDANVDLAILPLAFLIKQCNDAKLYFHYSALGEDLIPTAEVLNTLDAIEEITMIGYPNGLWDKKNNMPITRRGITATNLKHDYEGQSQFVIDCACFAGSSGSPVLIFNPAGHFNFDGTLQIAGQRLILLGVLFSGPLVDVHGEIVDLVVEGKKQQGSRSKILMNLGFVVKSQKILDFKAILIEKDAELRKQITPNLQ